MRVSSHLYGGSSLTTSKTAYFGLAEGSAALSVTEAGSSISEMVGLALGTTVGGVSRYHFGPKLVSPYTFGAHKS